MGRVAAVVLLFALVVSGCSSDGDDTTPRSEPTAVSGPSESAQAALRRVMEQGNNRQWGRRWDMLLPQHQAIVSRDRYIDCMGRDDVTGGGGSVTVGRIIDTYDEMLAIPGTDERLPATAITYEVTMKFADFEDTSNQTSHMYDVDGEWRWSLTDEHAEAYLAGECPFF